MTDQHLAEKRSLRSLKRRRIIAGRMKVFGSPYIPDRKMKRAHAVIDFRCYKEPMRDILPPINITSTSAPSGNPNLPEKQSWWKRLLAKIFGK